jgi:rhodanese-related sulfurtransferase
MKACKQAIVQMVLILVIGTGIAAAVNSVRGANRLSWTRDYFGKPKARLAQGPQAADKSATKSAETADAVRNTDDQQPTEDTQPKTSEPSDAISTEPSEAAQVVEPEAPPAEDATGGGDDEVEFHPVFGYKLIEFEQVREDFEDPRTQTAQFVFIDARNQTEYDEGHIPGALLCDHYRLEHTLEAVLPFALQAEKIIVYCTGGECEDSGFVCGDLVEAGVRFDVLYLYEGGWHEWKEAGMPVEGGE